MPIATNDIWDDSNLEVGKCNWLIAKLVRADILKYNRLAAWIQFEKFIWKYVGTYDQIQLLRDEFAIMMDEWWNNEGNTTQSMATIHDEQNDENRTWNHDEIMTKIKMSQEMFKE